MKIAFVTNFFNHHQKPLAEALYKKLESGYIFVETKPIIEERIAMGWTNEHTEYVQTCYNHASLETPETIKCIELINDADVVLTGSAPELLIKKRIDSGKLVFRWSERPMKRKLSLPKLIYAKLRLIAQRIDKKKVYMLCSSAYTAVDYNKLGVYRKRTYKWGYFPQTKHYESVDNLIEQKDKKEILWCGRFLDWKHPDDALRMATSLKAEGYEFRLNIIGRGELQHKLEQMVADNNLEDCVCFLGTMSADDVRGCMERAGIYLFTSDRNEGWGAVLNESMNSACGVVASHSIGSVPFLVEDDYNGLIYESGNIEMLCEKVKYLLDNADEQKRLGKAAYSTIVNEWNAEVASERFIELSKSILSGNDSPDIYEHGPCSRAPVIKEDYVSVVNFTKYKINT